MISEDNHIGHPEPVRTAHSGRHGRPRKEIDVDYLRETMASNRQISVSALARMLRVHRHTLQALMKRHGITRSYLAISNAELDILVRQFRTEKPDCGVRYLIGRLRCKGHRVQQLRVLLSVKRVDPLGHVLRKR